MLDLMSDTIDMVENDEYAILDQEILSLSRASFKNASPFPHIVIDNFLKPEVAESIYNAFPDAHEDFWYEYNNPIEIKLACNDPQHIPPNVMEVLNTLNSNKYLKLFSHITGIDDLQADPTLHGGGMHCIKPGGKLDIHIDYSIHPSLKLERRLNLIIYLNKNWQAKYGGELELWEQDMSKCARKILPVFNRAVIFATDDTSYHGHPEPLRCPNNMARKSLALYYLTTPRNGSTERYRAAFVARPGEEHNTELDEIRKLRAGLDTAHTVYKKKLEDYLK